MPLLPGTVGLAGLIFWSGQTVNTLVPTATPVLAWPNSTALHPLSGLGVPHYNKALMSWAKKHHISAQDLSALLDYHNHIRATVHPPAANMEYMQPAHRGPSIFKQMTHLLSTSCLGRAAGQVCRGLGDRCIWAHGPSQLMRYVGQNLSIHTGRHRWVVDLVRAWSEERRHYSFPAPAECTPRCPWRCSGPVCSHYTQMVWASSSRLVCAIHTCGSTGVWGSTWRQAVYLVCNYAIKGNWIGEAPYEMGRPCSACPPSYQGSCSSNLCLSGLKSNQLRGF